MYMSGNAALSGQQKREHFGGATEVVAVVMDYALWLLSNWSSQTDSLRH